MKRSRRILLIVLFAVLVAAIGIIVYCSGKKPTPVILAPVQSGSITATVSATGTIEAVQEVQISSLIVGDIVALPVREGQKVNKGTLLIQLNRTEYQARALQAQAGLELAQASLAQSRTQWQRAQALFESELISAQEKETAQTQYLLDQARLKQARAALDLARRQLDQTTIRSPINGVITQLNVKLGETVIPGTTSTPGTILMVISDLSAMRANSTVSETDIPQVRIGMDASITVDALPGKTFKGRVSEMGLAPVQTPQIPGGAGAAGQGAIVNYTVKSSIRDSIELLRPGMTATVNIITAQKESILVVPIQAVITRPASQIAASGDDTATAAVEGQVSAVFVDRNGVARLVAVQTGIAGENSVEIVQGLEQGQRVVTGPFNTLVNLTDGTRITPQSGGG